LGAADSEADSLFVHYSRTIAESVLPPVRS
jgi:hypothetical protein